MINIGILGFGKSVNRYHLPYLYTLKNIFNVKKIYARTKREPYYSHVREKWKDVIFKENIEAVLNDSSIDLVLIGTPVNTHYDFVKRALLSHKNVLVEKPFVRTYEEAQELINLAESKGLLLLVYQNRRFDSDFLLIKKLIRDGTIKDIYEVKSQINYSRPLVLKSEEDFTKGLWYSIGSHMVDQIVDLFGSPMSIFSNIKALRKGELSDDYFSVDFYYERENLKVNISASLLVASPYNRWELRSKNETLIKKDWNTQERDLKQNIYPQSPNFGFDGDPAKIYDFQGNLREEFISHKLNWSEVYKNIYEYLNKKGKLFLSSREILLDMKILETGIKNNFKVFNF